ncbi:MAG TPA: hypothetical protein VFB06_11900 [Streptosporangiaceae bacterium]|nr:hypothetical protein [Streptosporangiaceae bacterium]
MTDEAERGGELNGVAVDPADEEAEQFGELDGVAEVDAHVRHSTRNTGTDGFIGRCCDPRDCRLRQPPASMPAAPPQDCRNPATTRKPGSRTSLPS